MKIIIYTQVYPDNEGFLGGIFIHNQAMALKRAGHDICVAYLDLRSLRKKRKLIKSKYQLDSICVYRLALPISPFKKIINCFSESLTNNLLNWAIRENGLPDVFYAHFGDYAYSIIKFSKKVSIPYVVIEHASSILTRNIGMRQFERITRAYNEASRIISVSNALKNEISKITYKDITVIPNILPNYFFSENTVFKKNDTDFTFVSVGNLIKRKSFDITISAFAKVCTQNSSIKLYIVGKGEEENSLKQLVSKLNLCDKVFFLGQIDNQILPKTLMECNCFVLPSKFETFGVVYIEAMSCGIPVIATKCGGPEEFINEMNGLLIDVDNVDELVDAMIYMIDNCEKYDSKLIKEYAYNISSEETVTKKIEKVLYEAIIHE